MDLKLKGRVAIVSGASKGLGRACALALAAEGADIALCARDTGRLSAVAEEIRAMGSRCAFTALDLAQTEKIESFVAKTVSELGKVDILVNNAGGPPAGFFQDLVVEEWKKAFQQNLLSVIEMSRHCLKLMRANRWGRIINITSVSAKQPLDKLVISNSLRAGVSGLAKTLANENASFGITVNNVAPGFTATERLGELAAGTAKQEGVSEDDIRRRWIAAIPAGRLGAPDELARLVAFLAGEGAGYITGQTIAVDGGWSRATF